MAAQLIDAWPAPGRGGARKACRAALRLLRRLGDDAKTRRFLREVATPHYESGANDELLATAASADPATLDAWLPEFVATNVPRQPEAALDLLWRLCGREQSPADGAAPRRSHWRLRRVPPAPRSRRRWPRLQRRARGPARQGPTAGRAGHPLPAVGHLALRAGRGGGGGRPAARGAPGGGDPAAGAAKGVGGDGGGLRHSWRRRGARRVRRAVAACRVEPAGAQRAAAGGTRRLGDSDQDPMHLSHCRHLQAFCDDPTATTLRLPLRKELRRHVHGVIDGLGLDIRHQTDRKGSPYTLVCTKTRGAWQRRCAQYAEDIAHLRLLAAAAPRSVRRPTPAPATCSRCRRR